MMLPDENVCQGLERSVRQTCPLGHLSPAGFLFKLQFFNVYLYCPIHPFAGLSSRLLALVYNTDAMTEDGHLEGSLESGFLFLLNEVDPI